MSVDPYALCPCGSGKKLKFCCSDLVGDIEKIHRMIEGDQPRAALRHIEQALSQHPGRASLWDLKVVIELSLGEFESARVTSEEFLSAEADNPTAQACHALYLAETVGGREAVAPLQRALTLVERDMPQRVFEAIGGVGRSLLMKGHVLAAQAHLLLHAAIAPKDDSRARELLMGLNHYAGLPLLLRDQIQLREWPADASWRGEALEATQLSNQGNWQLAADVIDRLGQQYGADPTLVFNRALVGGWLADDRALVAGLHAYAKMDVPPDDAIEAEAIAQLLDPELKETTLNSVTQVYAVNDLDQLTASLAADPRIESFDIDPAAWEGVDRPRPQFSFVLLDRAMPATGEGLAHGDVPKLTGVLSIFGRQTDCEERLELSIDEGEGFDQAIATLTEVAGDQLGAMIDQRIDGDVSPSEQALNWRWHFPQDTPRDLRRELTQKERRTALVERWPTVSRPALGNKTPHEVAGDPQWRTPLLAALLILEHGGDTRGDEASFVELRDSLGLEQLAKIDPDEGAGRLPLVRVPRINVTVLADEQLAQLYHRSVVVNARSALAVLAQEVIRRPSMADSIPPTDAYRRVVAAEEDPERTLELIAEARNLASTSGEPTAVWDLAALELHITEGHAEEAKELLGRIDKEYPNDPEVAAAVYRLLYEMGIIPPEAMAAQQQGPPQDMPAMAETAASAPPADGKIWTPDSDRPAGDGGKSSLWTPS